MCRVEISWRRQQWVLLNGIEKQIDGFQCSNSSSSSCHRSSLSGGGWIWKSDGVITTANQFKEMLKGFDGDGETEKEEKDGIGETEKDLDAIVAKGELEIGFPSDEKDRSQPDGEFDRHVEEMEGGEREEEEGEGGRSELKAGHQLKEAPNRGTGREKQQTTRIGIGLPEEPNEPEQFAHHRQWAHCCCSIWSRGLVVSWSRGLEISWS